MRYVKIDTNKIYSISDVRKEHPEMSIPDGADLTDLGFSKYILTPPPRHNGWVDLKEGEPVDSKQTWIVTSQSKDRIINQMAKHLEDKMTAFVSEKGYDSMLSACSYATSTNPAYAAEGARCVAIRDEQWAFLYSVFDRIDAGEIEMPEDHEAFLSLFPAMTW